MQVAGRAHRIAGRHCHDNLIGRHAVSPQPVRVGADHDRPLISAERGRGRNARQSGKHRPHFEERLVLNFGNRLGVARQHQIPDRHASRVEPHDERRDGTRRHERPRAVDVTDRLGHRLRHIRARVEVQLHQRRPLDVLAFDVMNSGDVQEVIFVVVGEQAFHLGGVHSAKGLGYINDRQVETGENVDRHPLDGKVDAVLREVGVDALGAHGQKAGQRHGDQGDHDRQRTPQGKDDRIHFSTFQRRSISVQSRNWTNLLTYSGLRFW